MSEREPIKFRVGADILLKVWAKELEQEAKDYPVYCPLCKKLVSGNPYKSFFWMEQAQGKCECEPADRERAMAEQRARYREQQEQEEAKAQHRRTILQALASSDLPYDAEDMPTGWGEVVAQLAQEAMADDR